MTAPELTPATLDAAVEAAARALWEEVFTWTEAGKLIPWAGVDEPMVRNGMLCDAQTLVEAIAPILVAAERERIAREIEAFADACSARAERYAGELPEYANQHNQTVVEVFRQAAAIARAGTSEATR